jgi:hypothetical protein
VFIDFKSSIPIAAHWLEKTILKITISCKEIIKFFDIIGRLKEVDKNMFMICVSPNLKSKEEMIVI